MFQKVFLQGVIFGTSQTSLRIAPDAQIWLQNIDMQWHCILSDTNVPLPGPYIVLHGKFHRPYRICKDTNDAFFTAIRSFGHTNHSDDNHGGVEIAISSRMQSRPSGKFPLAGCRVAVKDNFDFRGTKTSLCSRSYLNMYSRYVFSKHSCHKEVLQSSNHF